MTLSFSGGDDTEPLPGCPSHNQFHGNERVSLVGQRQLAETLCRLLAAGVDPLDPEVTAGLQSYRLWRTQPVAAGRRAVEGGFRAADSAVEVAESRNRPVSEECGLHELERRRIRAAAPVVDALEFLWTADHASEVDGDKRDLVRAVGAWRAAVADPVTDGKGPEPQSATRLSVRDPLSEDDPAREAWEPYLASALDLSIEDFVHLCGSDWTQLPPNAGSLPHEEWFIAGTPAQLMLSVGSYGPAMARPVGRWDVQTLLYEAVDRHVIAAQSTQDRAYAAQVRRDLLRKRRRSFRYCPICMEQTPPEYWCEGHCMGCGQRWLGVVY